MAKSSSKKSDTDNDEALAAALQREFEQEDQAATTNRKSKKKKKPVVAGRRDSFGAASAFTGTGNNSTAPAPSEGRRKKKQQQKQDEKLARQLAAAESPSPQKRKQRQKQEAKDERLARKIAQENQGQPRHKSSSRPRSRESSQHNQDRKRSPKRKKKKQSDAELARQLDRELNSQVREKYRRDPEGQSPRTAATNTPTRRRDDNKKNKKDSTKRSKKSSPQVNRSSSIGHASNAPPPAPPQRRNSMDRSASTGRQGRNGSMDMLSTNASRHKRPVARKNSMASAAISRRESFSRQASGGATPTYARMSSIGNTTITTNRPASNPKRYDAKSSSVASYSRARTNSNDFIDISDDVDLRLAQKIDQEERDEAFARQLTQQNSRVTTKSSSRTKRRVQVYQVEQAPPRTKRWTCRRILSLVIPILIIVGAVVGLAVAFSGGEGLPSLPGGILPPVFGQSDPFRGVQINTDDATRWNNKNSGLVLEVQNALEDNWEGVFNEAIRDWDGGTPDALTLLTQKVAVDNACTAVPGKLKVCNGNYGETDWRGINQISTLNGFIISSVALLNEFHLAQASSAQRLYTMCHEIGHGFGLPHTDEDFFNRDLGNCMDYTINPDRNKRPDETNFVFLTDLYGEAPSRRRRRRMLRGSSSNVVLPPVSEDCYAQMKTGDFNQGTVVRQTNHTKVRKIDLGTDCPTVFQFMLLAK